MTVDERDRQTHHVVIAPFNGTNELRSEPLNRVCAGLVSWLPASSVPLNLLFRKLEEGNLGTGKIQDPAGARKNTDTGVDPVIAAGEPPQHSDGIIVARRFSKDLVVQADYSIGTENYILRGRHRAAGLSFGNATNELAGAFAGVSMLRN